MISKNKNRKIRSNIIVLIVKAIQDFILEEDGVVDR